MFNDSWNKKLKMWSWLPGVETTLTSETTSRMVRMALIFGVHRHPPDPPGPGILLEGCSPLRGVQKAMEEVPNIGHPKPPGIRLASRSTRRPLRRGR